MLVGQVQSNRIRQGKDKIRSWPRMKKMFAINFYPLECEEILSYTIQDYYWPRSSYSTFFEEPYIPQIREELHVEENTFLEEYVEVKEENIEISEEINDRLIMEEKLEIKIVEEIDENPIIEKYLEVEMVEAIEDEDEEESFKDLDEVKLGDCNIQSPIILVGDTETNFIDFIGVERFDLIIDSYLVNIVNCMKIKGQEVQVGQLMTFKFGKKTRKSMEDFKFHISTINPRTSLFQVERSDVGQNIQINLCNFYIWYFYVF